MPNEENISIPKNDLLFYNAVVNVLIDKYFDIPWRENILPPLAALHKPVSTDLDVQRCAARELLAHIPASHIALLSHHSFGALANDLHGQARLCFGFDLHNDHNRYFATNIWMGHSAAEAGILAGDEVVTINGQPTAMHLSTMAHPNRLVDWDTADINARIDIPRTHMIKVPKSCEIVIGIRRQASLEDAEITEMTITAREGSALSHAIAATRIMSSDEGELVAYTHIPYAFINGADAIIDTWEKLVVEHPCVCGAILDLRGRGGVDGIRLKVIAAVERMRDHFGLPVVAIIDAATRSQKEVIAQNLREKLAVPLIGAPTAGAVIPMSLANVGYGTILMYPSYDVDAYRQMDGSHGVQPDFPCEPLGPYAQGRDPLIDKAMRIVIAMPRPAKKTTVQAENSAVEMNSSLPAILTWTELCELRRTNPPTQVAFNISGEMLIDGYDDVGTVSFIVDPVNNSFESEHRFGSALYHLKLSGTQSIFSTSSGGVQNFDSFQAERAKALTDLNGPFVEGIYSQCNVTDVEYWCSHPAYRVTANWRSEMEIVFLIDAVTFRTIGRISTQSFMGGQIKSVECINYPPELDPGAGIPLSMTVETPMQLKRFIFRK